MRRSNKYAINKLKFYPLTGGIGVAQILEHIVETGMQECQNFIYDRNYNKTFVEVEPDGN